ncbi:polyketide cyclase [Pantoea sp. ARC607]|uniref:polyketide cyclase n=1 Tax=unclassified Pantoea TaxID=2630326 RepID=UPI000DAA120A|nr:polyketide cyclase [Pantoea sp. ARC607]PZL92034.1 polyketide cyclase [Pantoea sp. ARC607]
MLSSRTLSLTIPRHWLDLYETIWKPDFFPKWASGLTQSALEPEGNRWRAKGPLGSVKLRFSPHNPFGVMDHWIDGGSGKEIYVPMRVIANEQGAEVLVTIYRQPFTSDEKFKQDIEWVSKDLEKLNQLLTQ